MSAVAAPVRALSRASEGGETKLSVPGNCTVLLTRVESGMQSSGALFCRRRAVRDNSLARSPVLPRSEPCPFGCLCIVPRGFVTGRLEDAAPPCVKHEQGALPTNSGAVCRHRSACVRWGCARVELSPPLGAFSKSASFVPPCCGRCTHRKDFLNFFREKVLEKMFFNEMFWGV